MRSLSGFPWLGLQCTKLVLGWLHAKDLIHRDLKPANLFLALEKDGSEVLKLIDFGLVRSSMSKLTDTGICMGTAAYISPEQIDSSRRINHRADLYSAGILLFKLLTGKLPFYGSDILRILQLQTTAKIPSLQQVRPDKMWAPELERFIQCAIAKKPEDRPQNAEDFVCLCLEALEHQSILESLSFAKTQELQVCEMSVPSIQRMYTDGLLKTKEHAKSTTPTLRLVKSKSNTPDPSVKEPLPLKTVGRPTPTEEAALLPTPTRKRLATFQRAQLIPLDTRALNILNEARLSRKEFQYGEEHGPSPGTSKKWFLLSGALFASIAVFFGLLFIFTWYI